MDLLSARALWALIDKSSQRPGSAHLECNS
jgi:hypothetical protein